MSATNETTTAPATGTKIRTKKVREIIAGSKKGRKIVMPTPAVLGDSLAATGATPPPSDKPATRTCVSCSLPTVGPFQGDTCDSCRNKKMTEEQKPNEVRDWRKASSVAESAPSISALVAAAFFLFVSFLVGTKLRSNASPSGELALDGGGAAA